VLVVGRNHEERDEACTRASHYDILRYRPEEEARQLFGERYWPRISGTEKNERRRKGGFALDGPTREFERITDHIASM